jgi:hypothetical protein
VLVGGAVVLERLKEVQDSASPSITYVCDLGDREGSRGMKTSFAKSQHSSNGDNKSKTKKRGKRESPNNQTRLTDVCKKRCLYSRGDMHTSQNVMKKKQLFFCLFCFKALSAFGREKRN